MHTLRFALVTGLLAGCGGSADQPAVPAPAPAAAPAVPGGELVVPPGTPDRREAAGMDFAKSMADTPAPWIVAVHEGAEPGQWAEWEASGTRMWWGVTATRGDLLLVENRMQLGEATVVQGFLVDAKGNVQQAFVANYYADGIPDVGYPRAIMEKVESEGADGPEPTKGAETLNAAGRDWECESVAIDVGGKTAKTWMSDDGWFNKVIKAEYDGNVSMVLARMGTDARQGIRIPK